jgi:hypothetical protein
MQRMSAIREALEALADAIEAAIGAGGEEAAEVATPKKGGGKAAGKAKKTVTMEEVRAAFVQVNKDHGKPAVLDLLTRFGVTKLGDLPEANFAEALELASNYEPEPEPEDEEDPLGEEEGDDLDGDEEPEPEPEPAPRRKRNRSK